MSIISSPNLIGRLGLKIHNCDMNILTADRTSYTCQGYVNIPFRYQDKTRIIPTLVVPEISKDLTLGVDFLKAFNFRLVCDPDQKLTNESSTEIPERNSCLNYVQDYFGDSEDRICFQLILSVNSKATVETSELDQSLEMPTVEIPTKTLEKPGEIETEHKLTSDQQHELFQAIQYLPVTKEGNLGRTHILKHSIELLAGATPKRIPSYRWSPAVEQVIDEEIDRLLRLDVIEECEGSADFINPLLPIKKPTGKWRIYLDSRRLNSLTKKDDFPIPNMSVILQRIKRARYFSVIDLTESYYQVELEREAKNKTAFRTNKGLYRFKVMPFGLTNAPATMARLMVKVLGHDLEPYVHVYLDDIIITSDTLEDHLRLIKIVGERLAKAGLTINILKSKFCQTSIRYLGYVLSEAGLSMDVAKIQPILDYSAPRTVKEVRLFLDWLVFTRNLSKTIRQLLYRLRIY